MTSLAVAARRQRRESQPGAVPSFALAGLSNAPTAETVRTSSLVATGAASRVAPNILSIAHWERLLGGELYAPLSGTVLEVNSELGNAPEFVNDDPYGEGWLIRIRLTNPSEADSLLDVDAYKQVVADS